MEAERAMGLDLVSLTRPYSLDQDTHKMQIRGEYTSQQTDVYTYVPYLLKKLSHFVRNNFIFEVIEAGINKMADNSE